MARVTVAVVLLLLISGTGLLSGTGLHAQPAPNVYDDDVTILHLSESAHRAVRQDRLIVDLRAEATGGDATRVQAAINRRMTAALDLAHAAPSVQAETQGYWVRQERPPNAPPQWRGVQSLTLSGSDAAPLLKLAGELQQAGLIMSGLRFVLAPDTARTAEDELTATALQRLRDRADRIAAAMKLEIRSYRDLRVGNVSGTAPPVRFRALAAEPGAAAPPPAAEPGETTLQVNIDADVVLIPHGQP